MLFFISKLFIELDARVRCPKTSRNKTQLLPWGPNSLRWGENGGEESKRKVKVDTVADNKLKTFSVFDFARSFQPALLL